MEKDALVKRMEFALTGTKGVARLPDDGTAAFEVVRASIGRLALPTGRICVTDAYLAEQHPPLTMIVAPGDYPVELVIARMAQGPWGGDRGAFVVVTFSDEPVVAWTGITAVTSADPCYTDHRPNCIVQESATAIFSPEAGESHFALVQKDRDGLVRRLRGQRQGSKMCSWTAYTPDDASANVVLCKGGFGDGDVACYCGLAKYGRLARLVLDFGVADEMLA